MIREGGRTKSRRSPRRGERLWMSAWRAGSLSSPLRPPDTHQSHNWQQQQLICGAHFLAACRIKAAADVDGTHLATTQPKRKGGERGRGGLRRHRQNISRLKSQLNNTWQFIFHEGRSKFTKFRIINFIQDTFQQNEMPEEEQGTNNTPRVALSCRYYSEA